MSKLDTTDRYGKQRQYINENIAEFCSRNGFRPGDPEVTELRKKLETEAIRIYPMINESIDDERKERATNTFGITAFLGVLIAIFTGGSVLLPILAAAVTSFASVATIKDSYCHRAAGAFKSVLALHEDSLRQKPLDAKSKAANISAEKEPAETTKKKAYTQRFTDKELARRSMKTDRAASAA